jgi:hypothetical protein
MRMQVMASIHSPVKFLETDINCEDVGFEVLTAVSMEIAVFWVVAPCSLVEVYS